MKKRKLLKILFLNTLIAMGLLLNITSTFALTKVTTLAGVDIYSDDGGKVIRYTAGMAIDADGSPRAYGPNNTGLDRTANAGSTGKWWGIVTDKDGIPVTQSKSDPCPGMYVSPTSLANSQYGITDPRRYVDSQTIPYIAIHNKLRLSYGVKLGDIAWVYYSATGKGCHAIVADVGPSTPKSGQSVAVASDTNKCGEGSIALANALGINSDPRRGGVGSNVSYTIYCGSGDGKVKTVSEINTIGGRFKASYDAGVSSPTSAPTRSVVRAEPPHIHNLSGYYRIGVQHSGKVLDVEGGATHDCANIIQYGWHGGGNQRWRIESLGDGTYRIVSQKSGKVLDVEGGVIHDCAKIIQYGWHGGGNQRFILIRLDSTSARRPR